MFGQTIDLKKNKKEFPTICFMLKPQNSRFYLDFNDLLLFLKSRDVSSKTIEELIYRGEKAYDSIIKRNDEDKIITQNLKINLEEMRKIIKEIE